MDFRPNGASVFLLFVCCVGSVCAGVVNGLLGTGGGILLAFMFAFVLRCTGSTAGDNLVSSMAVILPVSVISLATYETGYVQSVPELLNITVPSALGGLAGAFLSTRIKPVLLEKIFAALVIYAGVTMLR